MVEIDGALGEGGGQVLRTALALSVHTGTPVHIHRIRAKRGRPGLARQHLTAVQAAAAISGATVEGDRLRSTALTFRPGRLHPGRHRFAVGTAGSASLVLQTVLPPLMLASEPSELILEGGTHNDRAPPFHFLREVFAPAVERAGPRLTLDLEAWGFFPAGGGRFTARIDPVPSLRPLDMQTRGPVQAIEAVAVVSQLPESIALRELRAFDEALPEGPVAGRTLQVPQPRGPGNVLMATVRCDRATELFTGFGRRGLRAEVVAARLAGAVHAFLGAEVPVGAHLADQLLLLLALAGGGRFRTVQPSLHTTTNAAVIARFLPVAFDIDAQDDGSWSVSCRDQDGSTTS